MLKFIYLRYFRERIYIQYFKYFTSMLAIEVTLEICQELILKLIV